MNRTLRNGLAVAGMAGGMLFLGQAVANADTGANQTVTPGAEANNLSLGSGGGAAAGNDTTAVNIAAQVTATSVSTNANTGPDIYVNQDSGSNNVNAYGGSGTVNTNTGNSTTIAVSTGSINGSGNISGDAVKAASGGGGGNVTANQTVKPTATANNASASLPRLEMLSPGGDGGAFAGNRTLAINAAIDLDFTSVSTNANTGPYIDVDQYSGDNDVTCFALFCTVNANTGNSADIKVETGDINNSANIGGAGHKPGHQPEHHKAVAPEHKAVMPSHQEKKATPVSHAATTRSATTTRSASQPKGSLAFTGAETSLPLTLGLIALGAGGGLTLAGRRRSSSAAV